MEWQLSPYNQRPANQPTINIARAWPVSKADQIHHEEDRGTDSASLFMKETQ